MGSCSCDELRGRTEQVAWVDEGGEGVGHEDLFFFLFLMNVRML
jgi:hypothetical protein